LSNLVAKTFALVKMLLPFVVQVMQRARYFISDVVISCTLQRYKFRAGFQEPTELRVNVQDKHVLHCYMANVSQY